MPHLVLPKWEFLGLSERAEFRDQDDVMSSVGGVPVPGYVSGDSPSACPPVSVCRGVLRDFLPHPPSLVPSKVHLFTPGYLDFSEIAQRTSRPLWAGPTQTQNIVRGMLLLASDNTRNAGYYGRG